MMLNAFLNFKSIRCSVREDLLDLEETQTKLEIGLGNRVPEDMQGQLRIMMESNAPKPSLSHYVEYVIFLVIQQY